MRVGMMNSIKFKLEGSKQVSIAEIAHYDCVEFTKEYYTLEEANKIYEYLK